jgi:serine/threonine protein kinase/WD40 repeat protein
MTADRNLLFGILALQMNFINRDELIAAMNAWALEKEKPLGEILRAQGALDAEEQTLLDGVLQKHVERHCHDLEKSLQAAATIDTVREALADIADAELRASLSGLATVDHGSDIASPDGPAAVISPNFGPQRYRVLRPHAKGGLGEVFVAHDEELHREVALKQMLERHADNRESRARFVQEAEITGSLEHPGIVPIYGLGADGQGRPFYAMRFIRGHSLQDAIRRFHESDAARPNPGERVLELRRLLGHLIAVCNAIEYAHSRGVLHRDIKPSNVMLGKFGETLVVDWGLAKPVGRAATVGATSEADEPSLRLSGSGGSDPTQMGSAVGTPAFMSPEQAAGRLDEVEPASDVYGLGATLYVLLTGRRPFENGSLAELLERVQRGDFPRPRAVKGHIPSALEAICLKAMALVPADRYPSARAMADDLEHWLADEPVAALPESMRQRAARWSRRHRGLVWSGAVSSFALIIAAALVGRYYLAAKANKAEAAAARATAAADRKLAEADRFSALLNRTRQRNARRAPGWVAESLDDLRAAAGLSFAPKHLPELRSAAAQCLASLDVVLQTPVNPTGNYACLSFMPGGSTLAVAQRNVQAQLLCSVLLIDPLSGQPTRRLPMVFGWNRVGSILDQAFKAERLSADGARAMAFSPPGKGRWLAVGSRGGELFRWDLDDPQLRSVRWRGHEEGVEHVFFSPDGNSFYSAGIDRAVRRWDVAAGWTEAAVYTAADEIRDCAIDINNGEIICTTDGDTFVLSPDKLEPKSLELGSTSQLAISPDGQLIASGEDGHVLIRRGSSRRLIREMYDDSANGIYDGGAEQITFSDDGTLLIAAASADRKTRLWYADNGRLAASIAHPGQGHNRFCVSPDGRRLAIANDLGAAIYTLAPSEVQSFVARSTYPIERLAASDDLSRIAYHARSRRASVWDRRDGRFVDRGEVKVVGRSVDELAISADGNRLAALFGDQTLASGIISSDRSSDLTDLTSDAQPQVSHLALAPDGSVIWGATAVAEDRLLEGEAVQAFDFVDRKPTSQPCVVTRDLLSGLGNVQCLAAGATWVLAGCRDGAVALVHAPDAQMKARWFVGKSHELTAVALSGDESLAVAGTEEGRVSISAIPDGKVLADAPGHADSVSSIAVSRTGDLIATASPDRTIRLWKPGLDGLQELLALQFHAPVVSVHLSADGSTLAALVAQESAVRLWDLKKLRSRLADLSLDW